MLLILAIIIILYSGSYFIFRKNQIFIKVHKWVDLATIIVSLVFIVSWVEIFHYSFLFVIYFFISILTIVYLKTKLIKVEEKRKKAQEVIKNLKNEEKILENEIEILEKK